MIKLETKIEDVQETNRMIRSGKIKVINLSGKDYILDVSVKEGSTEIRVYPKEFTYKGRNDGYLTIVDGSMLEILYHFSETINNVIEKGFGEFVYEIV